MAQKRIREAIGGALVASYVSGPAAARRAARRAARVDLAAATEAMLLFAWMILALVGIFALVWWAGTGEWPVFGDVR